MKQNPRILYARQILRPFALPQLGSVRTKARMLKLMTLICAQEFSITVSAMVMAMAAVLPLTAVEGFAFAPGCAVNVVNPPSGASYEVPMALVDVEGLDASNGWTVSVGGTPKANLRISASSTGLLIRPVGTQFILR